MKKLRWAMMVLIASFVIQGAMAQESTSFDERTVMLINADINDGQDSKSQVLLSDLLSTLEQHFDVTSLYKDKVMLNKYIQRDGIRIGNKTGYELSRILVQLGIAFQRIDEQT